MFFSFQKEDEITVQWASSECVLRAATTNTHKFVAAVYDAYTPDFPGSPELLGPVGERAVGVGARAVFKEKAWPDFEGEALRAHVSDLAASETDQI